MAVSTVRVFPIFAGLLALPLVAGTAAAQSRPSRPAPSYDAPAGAPYQAIHVTVPTPMGHTLAGTLTLPTGASASRPVAAVVTISGTGPQDRDEFLGFGDYRPFRQFADSLGRRGIAVLRMDDRGAGQSKGTFRHATMLDFVQDIRAGLAFLKTRPEIDQSRIGLLGHSEGAIDAPLVALEEPYLKALVLLAGQARPIRGAVQFQLENMVRHDTTIPPARLEAELARVPSRIDSIAAVDPYMKVIMEHDPGAVAKRVSKPSILILTGETDRQADATQVPEWVAAFEAGGNKDVTGQILLGLNHLFIKDPDGFPGGYAKLTPPLQVDPSVVGMVVDWLASRLK